MGLAKSSNRQIQGVGASPGIAIGRVRITDRSRVAVHEEYLKPGEVQGEVARFIEALDQAREELVAVRDQLSEEHGPEHLYVIETHLMMLQDSMFKRETLALIESEAINAEWALKRTVLKFRDFFAAIEDDYLRERVGDIEIVGERVLRKLVGKQHEPLNDVHSMSLVVAHDLSPADILQIDRQKIIGFVTDLGGKTSHSAILARSLEIPAVVGLERITSEALDGEHMIIDGSAGIVIINPDEETFREYLKRKLHHEYIERELAKLRDLPAITTDGCRISLKGNVEFIEEIPSLTGHGAEGIGLYRTEMLFFNRDDLPGEEEQFAHYSAVVKEVAPLPVTIRTLDVGGDKFVPDLNLDDELNPALGLRAIRLSLRKPETFRPQLRAILRASALGKVRIFFPMISGVAEIRAAKRLLEEAKLELLAEGVPFDEHIEIGIMIEIPSAVIIADLLAQEVDFFSVGTNDLIQYSLAIDRTNEHLANLYEPLHPAVLRSLKMVVDAAHAAGIDACMCGEMAGESQYLPILLGLGFDELSMNAISIPRVKEILRRCSRGEAEQLVKKALTYHTAEEIDRFLKSEITAHYADSFD
ncbi:phosphoenolpyruvate--protein phosphotransferase [Geobacter pelophilus]|uniref:Phosphoenolpyruvate-protein phosphotransferase n=1 Tax=Geoanaerobacter pelophilus TaxID=60036 RepID=A0AAW4L615_9BACT|nr:phosphoenolpyruvate--protein phosphotransferase [Geoanaerobacter pelophilus]MBT0663262.1 phosphoenolpyruvate--protein phosphotransferase [Geoanaerobacter pelophilus]